MARLKQRVQIGDSDEYMERLVRHRRTMLSLGIETGYVEHRRDDIPVWRPINPTALGLDQSWLDGVWRSVYNWISPAQSSKSQPDAGLTEYQIAGTVVLLPATDIEVAPALTRFLRQHLR